MPESLIPDARDQTAEHVRRARQGSADALAALYDAFGTRADAEDVLQDVFVGLPDALAHYQEQGALAAWLRRLTARTALMRLRRQRREASFSAAHDRPSGDTASASVIERIVLADALDRLAEPLRRVFLLKEVEGLSHREIAALLAISVGASEVRLHRAWRRLRELLGTREGS
jgi:RNA polymerase sigma-70 factor, ECF subfamily